MVETGKEGRPGGGRTTAGVRTGFPWARGLGIAAVIAAAVALYAVFLYAPRERTMGDVQRIFYLHVALAWNAYAAFFVVTAAGLAYLRRARWIWDALAQSAAEVGVLFTTLTLLTGTLWARPVWNTWWTWDPRLTTTLILWFMYVAYLLVRAATEGEERRGRISAVFGILAFLNVPLVHFSARWWRGLHPIIVDVQGGRPSLNMDPAMAVALGIAVAAMTVVNAYLVVRRLDVERVALEVRRLRTELRLVAD